jgi:hypothetical protein
MAFEGPQEDFSSDARGASLAAIGIQPNGQSADAGTDHAAAAVA